MWSKNTFCVISGLLVLNGCAALNPALATRAENAFRQHNEVASELLLLISEVDPKSPVYEEIVQAEERMLTACQALNNLAIQQRNRRSIGPIQKLKVTKTIAGCEEQTQQASILLGKEG